MQNVHHQVGDDILAGYAAGALPEAFDLVVAAHVSLSPDARSRLDAFEAVGGSLLEQAAPVDMSHGSLEATLAKITGGPEPEVVIDFPGSAPGSDDVLPGPVQAYVGGGLDAVRWRAIGMGAKQAILHDSGDASVRLLYIPAGSEIPDHGHHGTEMTLVLQGAFMDGDQRFARGDIEVVDEDTEHCPVADIGEDCICLAATEGKLRFSGLLPRLAQPFLKI